MEWQYDMEGPYAMEDPNRTSVFQTKISEELIPQ